MSKIKNGGQTSMAKCKALTGSAVKGLIAVPVQEMCILQTRSHLPLYREQQRQPIHLPASHTILLLFVV